MKTLVVYDSVFGNTERVARAIGEALGGRDEVSVVRPDGAAGARLADLRLLVVGSPTRGFRPTEAVAEFLKRASAGGLGGIKVAAFDTRLSAQEAKSPIVRFVVKRGGYAAKRIADELARIGGELVAPPEGFFVLDSQGPLRDGELERAAGWAKQIGAASKRG
jgi:flavodoxin